MPEIFFLCEYAMVDSVEFLHIALSVRLAGYQPQYFPRLHYFARILDSNIFTIADYVQYVRRHAYIQPDGSRKNGPSYQAHAIIKSRHGVQELGVPVSRDRFQKLRDAQIDYATPWYEKHLNVIEEQYRHAPFFRERFPEVCEILRARHPSLAHLTGATIIWGLSRVLGIPAVPSRASIDALQAQLPLPPFRLERLLFLCEEIVPPPDKRNGRDANDWLIDQCKTLGADEYYFGGTSAGAYMDFERFTKAGITLTQQRWTCEPYRQEHGQFISNLSILDLLMNVAPDEARKILHTKPADAIPL